MDIPNERLAEGTPSRAHRWKYFILIVSSIGIVYAQTLGFEFVTYDDYELVVQSESFLSNLSNIFTSFTTHVFTSHRAESGYYRPMLLISYILDNQLWGLNPLGYHLTNILLHCCSAIVVFLLLEKLLKQQLLALIGSLFFALHPIQTESVAWVAGRNDVLLGLFISAMLLSYLYYREDPIARKSFLSFSVLSFALALFTKESAVFFLILLPLYSIYVRREAVVLKNNFFKFLPFLLVVAVYLFVRWNVIGAIIGTEKLYGAASLVERLRQMPGIITEHCALIALPIRLSIVHSVDQPRWMNFPWSMIAIIIPLLLFSAVWYFWRKDNIICFGLLWFCVGLLPVLGIFPVAVPILEHRLYLPLIGITIVAGRALERLRDVQTRRKIIGVVAGFVLLLLATMSYVRLPVWSSSAALWSDAIEKAPTVSRSYFNLAGYYFDRQQYDSTANLLKKYIELKPDDFLGYAKLRQTYYLAGRYDEAARVNRQIINRNPTNPNRYLEAGLMYEQLRRYDSATALYTQGLQVDSNKLDLHFRLGLVYQRTGNISLAEFHFQRAVQINPRDPRGLFGLGGFYASRNDNPRAIELLERGMKLGTPPLDVAKLLSQLYIQAGQQQKAQQLAEQFHF